MEFLGWTARLRVEGKCFEEKVIFAAHYATAESLYGPQNGHKVRQAIGKLLDVISRPIMRPQNDFVGRTSIVEPT